MFSAPMVVTNQTQNKGSCGQEWPIWGLPRQAPPSPRAQRPFSLISNGYLILHPPLPAPQRKIPVLLLTPQIPHPLPQNKQKMSRPMREALWLKYSGRFIPQVTGDHPRPHPPHEPNYDKY